MKFPRESVVLLMKRRALSIDQGSIIVHGWGEARMAGPVTVALLNLEDPSLNPDRVVYCKLFLSRARVSTAQ